VFSCRAVVSLAVRDKMKWFVVSFSYSVVVLCDNPTVSLSLSVSTNVQCIDV
jgi:hypothetical protein